MPRTNLGLKYPPKEKPVADKPDPVIYTEVQARVVEKDLRKIPSCPFWVDLNTGVVYLDEKVMAMLK